MLLLQLHKSCLQVGSWSMGVRVEPVCDGLIPLEGADPRLLALTRQNRPLVESSKPASRWDLWGLWAVGCHWLSTCWAHPGSMESAATCLGSSCTSPGAEPVPLRSKHQGRWGCESDLGEHLHGVASRLEPSASKIRHKLERWRRWQRLRQRRLPHQKNKTPRKI